jgi:hypothetical protein
VPTADMLGPFEQRPLIQLAICLGAYTLIHFLRSPWSLVAGVVALALLPASVAVLGATHRVIDAINPIALWRAIRGLSWCYLLVVAAAAGFGAMAIGLVQMNLWNVLRFALLELGILSVFSFVGGAIYYRRSALGFEPRVSPERRAAHAERETVRLRSAMLDRVYAQIRGGNDQSTVQPLRQWLAVLPADQLETGVRSTTAQVLQWDDDHGVALVLRCLISHSLREAKPVLALQTVKAVLPRLPRFALDSEEDAQLLASHARFTGSPRLAQTLLENYRPARNP